MSFSDCPKKDIMNLYYQAAFALLQASLQYQWMECWKQSNFSSFDSKNQQLYHFNSILKRIFLTVTFNTYFIHSLACFYFSIILWFSCLQMETLARIKCQTKNCISINQCHCRTLWNNCFLKWILQTILFK